MGGEAGGGQLMRAWVASHAEAQGVVPMLINGGSGLVGEAVEYAAEVPEALAESAGDAWKDIVAGCAGGLLEAISCHPLDTAKVTIQAAEGEAGMVETLRTLVREEGVRGLYKGVQSPIAGLAVINSMLFGLYGMTKDLVRPADTPDHARLSLERIAIAGALTGIPLTPVESVIDLVKIQLQVQSATRREFTGYFDAVSQLLRTQPRSLLRGMFATLVRDVPANATYFLSYEAIKRPLLTAEEAVNDLLPSGAPLPAWKILTAGAGSGVLFWFVAMPMDVVKSVIQAESIVPERQKYKTYGDAVRGIYAKFGWRGFFRGFVPCMIRAAPSNAACFLGYEYARKALDWLTAPVS
ncbi:substrate carrier family protein G [Thecamonas trahens ATCC 50062]|uniref:Substrate carrier family protein G n=1 Tax=Thecamonas trahens ATCC 50062 TaxID=461836 RepID=A0A0L0DIJ7_THETB|nr:substrate carrier family protein G [Thecamonas trahens ATCC 50062]KNC51926.1 substrate carrier family protein G [Thecamonas trahens ATCC 50062]|eukprot:XP_013755522.1 substrate carrier family protein G [Thecamonas trahens ATCC 50062]